MLVLTKDTLRNPGALETRSLPKRFFGRVAVLPRNPSLGLRLRLLIEYQFLRYMAALLPFCVPMLIWPQSAAPISQAPLAMVLLIGVVELRVLGLSDRQRDRLMSEDDAHAVLDTLAFRARAALRQIAARQDLAEGDLRLVIEQSELARISPLTLVSVQSELPAPRVLDLDPGDRAVLLGLFDDAMTERALHRAGLRLRKMLHEVRIEAHGISAHARLAAWIDKAGSPEGAPA
jgi:hypothetical protein